MTTTALPPKLHLWLPGASHFFAPAAAASAFDPQGSWQHSYVLLNNAVEPPAGQVVRADGFLRLARTAGPQGSAQLGIELVIHRQYAGAFRTTMKIDADSDLLGTPRAWQVESTSLDPMGGAVPLSAFTERGKVVDGTIARDGMRRRSVPAPKRFTSNWSLFDVVQRLAASGTGAGQTIGFDLLEDLDLLKPAQELRYWGEAEIDLGGKPAVMRGYQQIGQGILPHHYWIDGTGRMAFAYGGLRAFVFNPQAEQLAAAAARQNAKRSK